MRPMSTLYLWLNISLSILLTFSLLGGIVFALRTASRVVKLSQMESDFVSNVSHEPRTPSASIRVFGEFLRVGRVRRESKIRIVKAHGGSVSVASKVGAGSRFEIVLPQIPEPA